MNRTRWLAMGMVLTVAAGVHAGPDPDELLRDAMRFPVITVPLTDQPPVADGRVDDAEWSHAAQLPSFVSLESRQHEGTASGYRTQAWMTYTPEALFIAFRAEYPAWAGEPVALGDSRDHSSGNESHFGLFINPTDAAEHGEFWHLCGNAKGALFDRHLGDPSVGMSWNPAVEYRARITDAGWEGEFKLPFEALGVAAPSPGDCWRVQLFFVRMRPSRVMVSWSPWEQWRQNHGGRGYGYLRFGRDAAAARFETCLAQADRTPQRVVVRGGGEGVHASIELLNRTDSFASGHPSMLMNLTRWHAERNDGGAAYIGATVETLTREVLKRFEPVIPPIEREAGAGDVSLELPVTPDLGEYLVRYQIVRGECDAKEVLAAGATSYRVKPQLDVTLRPMLLGSNLVEVRVDYSNMIDLQTAKALDVEVQSVSGGDPVFAVNQPITGPEPMTVDVPGDRLAVGAYVVTARVRDAAGKALAEAQSPLDRPAMPEWWTDPVGEEPLVPEPWSPVEVAQSDGVIVVSVWGRRYTFDGLPVPAAVTTTPTRYSTGEPAHDPVSLLTAPMAMSLRSGGAERAWKVEPIRVVEHRPDQVVLESRLSSGALVIRGRTTVEFDGLVKVELEIGPEAGAAAVDALEFVIPFKAEYATLLGNFRKAPGPGAEVERYLGALPPLPWTYPVFYAQTIGTDRFGLQWVCDSTRDWRQKQPNRSFELRRAGDAVENVFRFIDYPVTIEKPLRITFGLMALPVKPLPEGWGRLRITSSSFRLPDVDDPADVEAFKRDAAFFKPDIELDHNPGWSGVPWFPYPFTDPAAQDLMRRQVDVFHEAGLRYCPHSGWQAISTVVPEWKTFAPEMAIEPETETIGKTVFACYNSPYSLYTASLWAHHAKTVGIDGIKADTMFPQTHCYSIRHGCGWYDERGTLHSSVNIFATREFFKRLYRTFHGRVKVNGILNAAQTGVTIAPVCSFTDIVNISEGSPYHKATSIKQGYPQDLVRTLMVGAPYGNITIHDLKGLPLNAPQRIAALLVAGADPRFATRHYRRNYVKRAPSMFDYSAPCIEIWEAWDWIDRGGNAIWMPHWENEAVLKVSGAALSSGQTPMLYGSFYYQPGEKVLLIVSNYEPEAVRAQVRLDLRHLGFADGAVVHAEDAVTRVPIDASSGEFTLDVLGERYRLVRLWTGEPPRYADARLGPDLLTDGGFEQWPAGAAAVQNPRGQSEPAATQDSSRAVSGAASLRLDKRATNWDNGAGAVTVRLKPVTLEPGEYVVQGYLWADRNFEPPLEDGQPRGNDATAQVMVDGPGLILDPPAWASPDTGTHTLEEKTPGWDRFLIAFRVGDGGASPVAVVLRLPGVGSVWIDDVSLRKVVSP